MRAQSETLSLPLNGLVRSVERSVASARRAERHAPHPVHVFRVRFTVVPPSQAHHEQDDILRVG